MIMCTFRWSVFWLVSYLFIFYIFAGVALRLASWRRWMKQAFLSTSLAALPSAPSWGLCMPRRKTTAAWGSEPASGLWCVNSVRGEKKETSMKILKNKISARNLIEQQIKNDWRPWAHNVHAGIKVVSLKFSLQFLSLTLYPKSLFWIFFGLSHTPIFNLGTSFWRTWLLTLRRSWTSPTRSLRCSLVPPSTLASLLSSRGNKSRYISAIS